jgi:hypothetical protein
VDSLGEKNTVDGQIGGVRATFHILGCGKPRTFLGYWTFSYLGRSAWVSKRKKREGVAVYCNFGGEGDCLGWVKEEGWKWKRCRVKPPYALALSGWGLAGLGFGTTVGVWKRNPGIGNMDQSENSGMDLGVVWGRFRWLRNSLGVETGCSWSKAGAAKSIPLVGGGGMVASLVAWAVASWA